MRAIGASCPAAGEASVPLTSIAVREPGSGPSAGLGLLAERLVGCCARSL